MRSIGTLPGEAIRALLLVLLAGFVVLPFLVVVGTSVKTLGEVFQSPTALIPSQMQWSNYIEVFVRVPTARHLANSLIIALSTTVLAIALAAPAAYSMARVRFLGRGAFGLGVMVTQMFSPVIVLIPLFKLMKALHLLDTYAALIMVNTAVVLPFSVWMLTGFLKTVPEELEDAAMIDGLSRTGMLFRVILPLTAPGLVTTAIFAFVQSWNEFIFALVLVSRREMQPITMALYAWEKNNVVEWNYLMATAVVAAVPTVLLFMVVRKRLTSGLMTGAVKG
ncbi:MAG: carbohydrate ABC transporter permease [Candidatus Latescibacteria bacterium]|jgi:multiple sugar transport system permease protein|nr:carbohydrate ABC transporter permease [Candidatus Latescibacterota bacterium]